MHKFNIIKKEIEISGRKLIVETGRMAKQANGSVFITYGKTTILVTATMAKKATEGTDFFPLTVDFIEKMYASGKIPGGFFKRETKPSTDAILSARLIDRAIRPLFPNGFRNAVQIVITVLSFDGINNPGALGIFGASLALSISDIPFNGPIAGIAVGLKDENIIINPSLLTIDDSELILDVAGTESSIVMIEAGANEITEEQMLSAIYEGHEVIKELIVFQKEFTKEAGKEKIEVKLDTIPEEIMKKIESEFGKKIEEAAALHGKLERYAAFDNLKNEILEKYAELDGKEEYEQNERFYKNTFEELVRKFVRNAILVKHHRVDGRDLDDIRPITCEIDILPQVHGSALFTRGETQALAIVTLGTERDEQVVDGLEEEFKKRFFLHYNFPPFSVGETGFMRGPGRRELGHGALAERALRPMMPNEQEFPYTVRLVSEILESNGSSSMATVCSGTLALMAAGVPIKKPVAGIANGLIMENGEYVVLTDIMGLEDHLGDMDFKVTGTRDGITAMQMDIKIDGISRDIMKIALEKANNARNYILDIFEGVITESRKEIADSAPQIEQLKIPIDKIGELIGPGGKMIKHIIEQTSADINIKDDGTVSIASPDKVSINKAKDMVLNIVSEPEFGKIYDGIVTRVEVYGVFVKFMGGSKEGLVHISQMHELRLNRVEDMLKLGDEVKVKYIGMDKGKFKLTMKGVQGNPEPKEGSTKSRDEGDRRSYRDRDNRSRDHHNYNRRDRRY